MPGVIEAVSPLDAQARVVGGAVAPLDIEDFIVLDVIGELAAHAAVRTQRMDGLVGHGERHVAGRHERAGRTGLHALAAADAGRRTHGIVHVEHDLGVLAAEREADDVVDLLVAAGPYATSALDARVEVDCNRRMREIRRHRGARGEARLAHLELDRPLIDLVVPRVLLLRHVGLQKFDHQLLRLAHPLAVGRHLHARRPAHGSMMRPALVRP